MSNREYDPTAIDTFEKKLSISGLGDIFLYKDPVGVFLIKEYSFSISGSIYAQLKTKVSFDVTRLFIAINLYKQRHKTIPQSLHDLIPNFIDSVPSDQYNKKLFLRYRVFENGAWLIYSSGKNAIDDGGEPKGLYDEDGFFPQSIREPDLMYLSAPPYPLKKPK